MSANLEYLICSLPHLTFDDAETTRLRVVSLLKKYAQTDVQQDGVVAILEAEAKRFLSPRTFDLFEQINVSNILESDNWKGFSEVLRDYSAFISRMRIELKRLRIARKEGAEASALETLSFAFITGNPLEEELQLIQLQWNELEALAAGHYSDLDALILYKMKLLLLERWWSFNQEKGFEAFVRTTSTLANGG